MEFKYRWPAIFDRYYPPVGDGALRDLLFRHSRSVADLAAEINERLSLGLDPVDLEDACMLHDIGIRETNAPAIHCHGTAHYLCHGVEGARLLEEAECPQWLCRIAKCHTGTGLTAKEITERNLPIPPGDYMPKSLMERLVCYADKFYSKTGDMKRKPIERVRASLAKFGPESLRRFEDLREQFHNLP